MDGQGDYYRAPPTSSGGAIKRNKSADVDIVLKEYFIECHDILL